MWSFVLAAVSSPSLIALTVMFFLVSSITTLDKSLIVAKRNGLVPEDQPLLPEWVKFLYWVDMSIKVAMFALNWRYAMTIYVIGFVMYLSGLLRLAGNIFCAPLRRTC